MSLTKISAGLAHPQRHRRGGREDGVCFLLVTFLCTSKEK
ncbi:Hypothetical Protein XCAW_00137 [Xanthomonas citri subsp. citri Aw12879]|nr:Hypothetical Protein XCAW_00137 [Xanthomonas citri subsp. citri Aw12879]